MALATKHRPLQQELMACCCRRSSPAACSRNQRLIEVRSVNDISKRQRLPGNQTVVLELQSDVNITNTLILGAKYSCTIICSAAGARYALTSDNDMMPALSIMGAADVLWQDVDIRLPIVNGTSTMCTYKAYQYLDDTYCPAVVVLRSSRIQVANSSISGGVHIFQGNSILLDSCTVESFDFAVILGNTGGGYWTTASDGHVISNNILRGYVTGVNIAYGSVGVQVINNYITDFIFSGISLGRGAHNVADAMNNDINNNYITVTTSTNILPDGAGIYAVTHWINPNNTLRCNYVVGPAPHCLYLDFASSDYLVNGMVYIGSGNGLKANTGHHNFIYGMVIAEPYLQPGFIAPQLLWNCASDPGAFWDEQRKFKTSINGTNCNTGTNLTAEQTGNCSGMPTGNLWQSVVLAATSTSRPQMYGTDILPTLPLINSIQYLDFNESDAVTANSANGLQFADVANNDYGLPSTSPIYDTFSNFPSCPRAKAGPQAVLASSYMSRYYGESLRVAQEPEPKSSSIYLHFGVVLEIEGGCLRVTTKLTRLARQEACVVTSVQASALQAGSGCDRAITLAALRAGAGRQQQKKLRS
eukprot:SM000297S10935  [mRNA]  locus=s297:26330:30094:- [translate_table: standard]